MPLLERYRRMYCPFDEFPIMRGWWWEREDREMELRGLL